MIQPTHDRVLVKYLDDPEHLDSRVIALVRQNENLLNQAGLDPLGQPGDYRRVMRRAEVVATGVLVDPGISQGTVIYCAAWDDLDGLIEGHAMIRQADIALIEN